ncbi:Ribokinase-like protein [Xylaria digitata]|nr:Ribokinase-like protein [Xylaria digitata]
MGQKASSLKNKVLRRRPTRDSEPQPLPQPLPQSLPQSFPQPFSQQPTFVSLGMFHLQEIHCPGCEVQRNVLGGAGLWATFGARLFKPGNDLIDVGCIIFTRNDVPGSLDRTLESWGMALVRRSFSALPCARAILDYRHGERSSYFSEDLLRPAVIDLNKSILLVSKSFHFVCPPKEIPGNITLLQRLRAEPVTALCEKKYFKEYLDVMRYVDVFSPNHHELVGLTVGSEKEPERFSHRFIEKQALKFIQSGIGPGRDGLIAVRCGKYGCFYMKNEQEKGWVGTFYDHRRPEVKNVTGAGSAFIGAFMVAFVESRDPRYSCFRGTVAASFALEQYGLPKKENNTLPRDHPDYIPGFRESWNGTDPFSRLGVLEAHSEMFYQKEYPGGA